MIKPNECKHEKTRKAGKYLTLGKVRQKLQCIECGKIILDEVLE